MKKVLPHACHLQKMLLQGYFSCSLFMEKKLLQVALLCSKLHALFNNIPPLVTTKEPALILTLLVRQHRGCMMLQQ